MWFFCIIICTIVGMTAAPAAHHHKKPQMQLDVEQFISQLLKSQKFEQLADKIAARAAEKIASMQHLQEYRTGDNAAAKPTSETTKNMNKTKARSTHKIVHKQAVRKTRSNKTKSDTNDQEKLPKKTKIDTIAAIKKIAKFPAVDLSLNFKHFANRDKKKSKAPKPSKKKENKSKSPQRKKTEDNNLYARAGSETESDSSEEASIEYFDTITDDENIVNENIGDVHIGDENEKSRNTDSSDTENDSVSNESKDKSKTLKTKDKVMVKNNTPKVEKSQDSDSVDEAKLDSKPKKQKDNKNSKIDVEKNSENHKHKSKVDNQKDKVGENYKKNDDIKIDTKHKVRENRGKMYAYAQSPDYEEYHEEVGNLLKSIKNKEMDQNYVNQDLMDFIN